LTGRSRPSSESCGFLAKMKKRGFEVKKSGLGMEKGRKGKRDKVEGSEAEALGNFCTNVP
jgi:hypothetical protein